MLRCLHQELFPMTYGQRSNRCCRRGPRGLVAGGGLPRIGICSTPCSMCCGRAVRGGPCRRSSARGRPSTIALPSGVELGSSKTSSGDVCTCTTPSTASPSTGKRLMGLWSDRRWGEKENGPNPTDRAKPGMKDHILVDGRGVPLSILVTPANVNDGPKLNELIDNMVIVRRVPTTVAPQHLALDAAFDNESARAVVYAHRYIGHISPKGGRAQDAPRHPGAHARRWVVERTHAWHDRFRRLVVNWEKKTSTRYAFLCLACALIAYRT